ncbi:MAG: carbon-nitrogen hydrolase family protein [Geminicoccaceae bacterium]
MRIALFQGPSHNEGVAANLDRLEETAREAARLGAGLLIAPEMFLSGYAIGPERVRSLAEPVSGSSAARAAAIARDADIALLYGYPELGEDGQVYNAALLLDRSGVPLANHRKTHLFSDLDRGAFAPGHGPPTLAELDGVKVGVLICYDVEFPENVRALAVAGAELVAVPTANMVPFSFVMDHVIPTRAYENHLFVAYVNRCGSEDSLDYLGGSCVCGPDGTDLARAGAGEALLTADLDLTRLRERPPLNTYLADRRPELYAGLTATGKRR